MNIAEENAAARAKAGVRTVTHEELTALAKQIHTTTPNKSDVYSNPPDGYKLALEKLPPEAPTVAATVPTRHGFKTTPNTVEAPDGYQIALDKLRKEGQ